MEEIDVTMEQGPLSSSNCEEENQEDSFSSSSSIDSSELAPKLQEQFHNLSSVLMETNENLLSFEFMLKQYQQLAKIRPLLATGDEVDIGSPGQNSAELMNKTQLEQSEKLGKLLLDIADAVDKMSFLKTHLNLNSELSGATDANATLKITEEEKNNKTSIMQEQYDAIELNLKQKAFEVDQANLRCSGLEKDLEVLKLRSGFLESEVQNKSKLCDQLRESVHRAREALNEEREKASKMDLKLETEKRAAQKIGHDITRYVSKMKDLEEEVETVKRERNELKKNLKRNQQPTPKIAMQGDTLQAVIESRNENEQDAAQKIGHDITSYVSKMKDLEEEVETLKRERNELRKNLKRNQQPMPKIAMQGDTLTAVLESPKEKENEQDRKTLEIRIEDTQNIVTSQKKNIEDLESQNKFLLEKVQSLEIQVQKYKDLLTETELKMKTMEKEAGNTGDSKNIERYEQTIRDYESQMRDLRFGLENLQQELEEKCRLISDANTGNVVEDQLKTRSIEDYNRLKAKSKTLLKQYRQKKLVLESQEEKLSKIKEVLFKISTECNESERNYRMILSHLGSEFEITVRLMAAYLNVPVLHQPVQCHGRKLSEWFCDIQALASWLQRQLLAFGKRYWTDKEPRAIKSKILPLPKIPVEEEEATTISQMTLTSAICDKKNQSIQEILECQENIVGKRAEYVQDIITTAKA